MAASHRLKQGIFSEKTFVRKEFHFCAGNQKSGIKILYQVLRVVKVVKKVVNLKKKPLKNWKKVKGIRSDDTFSLLS